MPLVRQILIAVVLVAVGLGAWYGFGRALLFGGEQATVGGPAGGGTGRPGGGPPGGGFGGRGATLVVTAPVTVDDVGLDVRAVGTATAARAVTVYPQVSGVVEEVLITPGSMVAAGDVLVRLADDDQDVALERARLALETATAALERAERLSRSNNITTVALTDAETAVRRAEIDLRQAEVDLARRTVRAPFAGRVGLTDIVVGDLINSTTAVATLDDMSSVTVPFDVPERATGLVRTGHPITATAEALPGVRFEGEITEVDSRVDGVTRTLRVRATLPNSDERLKPGMAFAVLLNFEAEARPQVPSLAVQWDREGPFVWQVVDGTARRASVDIVDRRSGQVTVVGALREGDAVVVEGLQSLRDGAAVRTGAQPERPADGGRPGGGTGDAGTPVAGAPRSGAPTSAGADDGSRPAARPGAGSAVAGERGPGADGQRRRPDGGPGGPRQGGSRQGGAGPGGAGQGGAGQGGSGQGGSGQAGAAGQAEAARGTAGQGSANP